MDQFEEALMSGTIVSYFFDGCPILGMIKALQRTKVKGSNGIQVSYTAIIEGFQTENGLPIERTVDVHKLYFASEIEKQKYCKHFAEEHK